MYYHACVFARYADLSGVINVWSPRCDSLLVVEHPADGKTKRIHCHFLIETKYGENVFREDLKSVLGDYARRGNYWIALRIQKGPKAGQEVSRDGAVYLLKRDLPVSFVKNFSHEEVEASRLAWVDSDKDDNNRETPSQRMIRLVLDRYDYLKSKSDLPNDGFRVDTDLDGKIAVLFTDVRSETMKMFLRENHQTPHPSQYKIVASTVFIKIMQRIKLENRGINKLLETWY